MRVYSNDPWYDITDVKEKPEHQYREGRLGGFIDPDPEFAQADDSTDTCFYAYYRHGGDNYYYAIRFETFTRCRLFDRAKV